MAFADFKFYSEVLGMQTGIYVCIPQKKTNGEIGVKSESDREEYKCLYLLHGLSDDHTIWLRRTSIERYAAEYGVCVVMPCVDRSFYTDMKYGLKYYSYVTYEIPKIMREFFHVSDKREDNYICGLSMGGYGALKIGMRNCDRFCACAGLSPVADIRRSDFKDTLIPVFGENMDIPDEEDLFKIAEKCNERADKPRIFMGVGKQDFMYDDTVRLKEKFESLDFDFTYMESDGTHEWGFWDVYIQYVLKWMLNL